MVDSETEEEIKASYILSTMAPKIERPFTPIFIPPIHILFPFLKK